MLNRIKNLTYIGILSIVVSHPLSAGTPWSQIQGSAAHNGCWDGKMALAGVRLLWSQNLGLFNSTRVAVSSDGTRLFATAQTAEGAIIYGLNASDGSVLWSVPVNSRVDWWSTSSPVYDHGYVYWAGSKYDIESLTGGTGKFNIYQIDANTGEIVHNWSKDSYIGEIINNSPTIANGKLYISTYGATADDFYAYAAHHFAINLTDGETAWTHSDGGQGQGCLGFDGEDQFIIQSTFTNGVHTLSAYHADSGSPAWTTPWASAYALQENAVAYDPATDAVYVQDYKFMASGSNISRLYKLSALTGEKVWEAETPSAGSSPAVVGPDGSVYVSGDYRGSGQTFKFNSDGQLVATVVICGGWSASPVWADGYLFVSDQNWTNTLYILDDNLMNSEGNPLIAKTLQGSGPVSFGLDTFYTIGSDGVLYAYEAPLPGDANHDRKVDVSDLGILAAGYGSTTGAQWDQGDFNGDGKIDVSDLGILAAGYGSGTGKALDFNKDARILGLGVDAAQATEKEADSTLSTLGCGSAGITLVMGIFMMTFCLNNLLLKTK